MWSLRVSAFVGSSGDAMQRLELGFGGYQYDKYIARLQCKIGEEMSNNNYQGKLVY